MQIESVWSDEFHMTVPLKASPHEGSQCMYNPESAYVISLRSLSVFKLLSVEIELQVDRLLSLCVWVFCMHVCKYTVCMPGAYGSQKSVSDDPGTGVADSCEPHVGAGNQTLGPLEEQAVLLATEHEVLLNRLLLK